MRFCALTDNPEQIHRSAACVSCGQLCAAHFSKTVLYLYHLLRMLQYNTHNTRLPMPEYGRYVQQLVDKCVTIEDRDERNAFAAGIVATICNLFPQQKTSPEWRDKLWDHLAIMSDFKLDIDYPREVTRIWSRVRSGCRCPAMTYVCVSTAIMWCR